MSLPTSKLSGDSIQRRRASTSVRAGLVLFFLLVVFDGALRKWIVPSQEAAIFVLKDVVLWGTFGLYAMKRDPFKLPRPVYSTWVPFLLAAYIFIVLAQAFNVRQPSILVSAIGLKAHLAYIPLVVLLPPVVAKITGEQIERFLWRYAILIALPIFALSIYQFSQPPTAWINTYVEKTSSVAKVSGFARIIGPFPYIGSYIKYLQLNAFLGVSAVIAGLKYDRKKMVFSGGIIFATTAVVVPMTGSRSPVVVILGGIFALMAVMRGKKYWLPTILGALVSILIFVSAGGDSILLQGWEALIERTERSGLALDRIIRFLSAPITGVEEGGIFGYGVGTNHQAAPGFVSGPIWEGWIGTDNRVLRVFVELGALGFMVLTFLKTSLLYIALHVLRQSKNVVSFLVGATSFCVLINYLILPTVYNVVSGSLYWGAVGASLGMWSLQQVVSQMAAVEAKNVSVK